MAVAIKLGKLRNLKEGIPYSPTRIKVLVRSGVWREGIHYITDLSGDRLYNLPLIQDWVLNQRNLEAHQRAINAYLASQNRTPINLETEEGGSING
jgi:hypothetical protein